MLRTSTILPTIRISWDIYPTFMLILGGFQGLSTTYEQAHVVLDLLTLVSYNITNVCKRHYSKYLVENKPNVKNKTQM